MPTGMNDRFTMNRLLQANKQFSGLAISLAVHHNDGRAPGKDVVASVDHFVRDLLRDADFACQTSDDEFLILCPDERASDAQRRLTGIAEALWDFQLRSIGTFSILFSWGDAHAEDVPLSEAIAAASERMHQTRRTRKTVSLESTPPLRRKAVAAV
jgi:GGDEF domain-containing protein